MELLTGVSLAALLRAETTLEPLRAAQILRQCASGLAAAHEAGVIHRDLKPDNVYLTRSGDHELVKLLDFGVAKMAGAGRLTRAGMVFGTPHYMSPEQAAGQSVDGRADIYALGIIFYECLAGRVPFEADTYMGVLTKHMFATPEPIERVVVNPAKLGAFAPIAMRCLEKSPSDRFATMTELGTALDQAITDALAVRFLSTRPPRHRASPAPAGRPSSLWTAVLGGSILVVFFAGFFAVRAFSGLPAAHGARSAVDSSSGGSSGQCNGDYPAAPEAAPGRAAEVALPASPSAIPSQDVMTSLAPTTSAHRPARGPSRLPGGGRPRVEPKAGRDVVDPWGK
jgi:serine/threonine-protein kinase